MNYYSKFDAPLKMPASGETGETFGQLGELFQFTRRKSYYSKDINVHCDF